MREQLSFQEQLISKGRISLAALLKSVIEDGLTHSFWQDPESDEVGLREATSIALFRGKFSQQILYVLSKVLKSGVVGVLHGDFSQLSDPLLFYVFKQVVPERDEIDVLIVEFDLLSIRRIHYPSFDFEPVVSLQDSPGVSVDELVVFVLS